MALVLFHFFAVLGVIVWNAEFGQTKHLSFAAGPLDSETYALADALSDVVQEYHPDIDISVLETRGSHHNMELLEAGAADFAIVLADTNAARPSRIVAPLFDEYAQIISDKESGIESTEDLLGRRIAIPPRGSSDFALFWLMMDFYNIDATEIDAVSMSWNAARYSLEGGIIDAIFAVRSLGNQQILDLLKRDSMRLIPISAASGIVLSGSSLRSGVIERGTYGGPRPIPNADLQTFRVNLTLIAHRDANFDAVRAVTETLFERRQSLMQATMTANYVRPPTLRDGTLIPIHDGARSYYDKDEPGFLQENAELLAFLVSALAISLSGLIALFNRGKRRRVDFYTRQLVSMSAGVAACRTLNELTELRQRLHTVVGDIARDAESGQISTDSFEFVTFTWTATETAIRERSKEIRNDPNAAQAE